MRSSLLALLLVLVGAAACSSSSSPGEPSGAPPATPIKTNPGESPESKNQPKDPETQIVIGVDGDDFRKEGLIIERVEITAKVAGVVAANETFVAEKQPPAAPYPREVRIAAPANNADAEVEITVVARGSGTDASPAIATRTARARFVKGKTKLAHLFLEIRCNTYPLLGGGPSGPTCSTPGETCITGKCRLNVLADLPDFYADWAKNPPSRCGTGSASTVDLGKGEQELLPLAADETLQIEAGGQCGHHLWLGARIKDVAQYGTTTIVSATQPGTGLTIPATAYPYAYGPAGDGSCELPGIRFQVDLGGMKAQDFLGKPLDVKIEAKDKLGRTATTTKRINVSDTVKGNFPHCGAGG